MREIKVIPKTENGKKAIEQHIKNSHKVGHFKMRMFNMMGFKEFLNIEPLYLSLIIGNSFLSSHLRKDQITELMNKEFKDYQAEENVDYTYEVIE